MTNGLTPAQHLLAELHAETQQEEKRLLLMQTEGVDHFPARIQGDLAQMGDHDLDSFTHEAGAQ